MIGFNPLNKAIPLTSFRERFESKVFPWYLIVSLIRPLPFKRQSYKRKPKPLLFLLKVELSEPSLIRTTKWRLPALAIIKSLPHNPLRSLNT